MKYDVREVLPGLTKEHTKIYAIEPPLPVPIGEGFAATIGATSAEHIATTAFATTIVVKVNNSDFEEVPGNMRDVLNVGHNYT